MALTSPFQVKRPTATPAQLTAQQPVQQATTQPAAPLATTRPTATAVQGALTTAKAPTNTVRPGGALPTAAATTTTAPRPAAQPSAQQQALLAADQRPMTAADNDAARAYDLANGVGQPAPVQTLAGRGPGINPQTGQRYTQAELDALAGVPNTTGTDSRSYLINPQTGRPYTDQELASLPPGQAIPVQGTNGLSYVVDPNTGIAYTQEEYNLLNTAGQGGPVTSTGPGITGGVQQTQFTGMDLTDPGAAEQFFSENAWRFGLPNALTEQGAWWQQNMGQAGQPGVAEDTFTSTAPQLRNQGLGENYVENLAGTYRPGSYPTGTNRMSGFADDLQRGSVGTNLSGEFAADFRPGSVGTNLTSSLAENFQPGADVSNRADEFFQQFMASMPEINPNAGLDPYYDRARAKAAEDINRQMAARGMWGSSAAGGMIGDAMTELGAEQANREAQYYLDTLGEMRGWQGLGGDLASSSDTSSRGKAENERAWRGLEADVTRSADDVASRIAENERGWAGLGADVARSADDVSGRLADQDRQWAGLEADVNRSADDVTARLADQERGWATDMGQLGLSADAAQRARLQQLQSGANDSQRAMLERLGFGADMTGNLDQAELQRLIAGMNAASQAQSGQRQRGQDYFNNTMGMGGAMADTMAGQYNPMITEDKTILDDILSMLTGSGAERLAGAQRQTAGAQQTQNSQQQALMTAMLMMLL